MPNGISKNLIGRVTSAAIDAAWIQWRAIGSFITAQRTARSFVDPEALILLSLALRDRERRLWDVLASWAKTGTMMLSVQRIKNLQRHYSVRTRERLGEFAYIAANEGGDLRWRSLVGDGGGPPYRDRQLRNQEPGVWTPAALTIRLRLGMGVGLPADLLTYLISLRGGWATVRGIAEATGYNSYAIRRIADKIATAQFIESKRDKPQQYRADYRAWCSLLKMKNDVPKWRYWHKTYPFICDMVELLESKEVHDLSPYLLSSSLRDLTSRHKDAIGLSRLPFPEPNLHVGEEYTAAFVEALSGMADWIQENA